MKNSVANATEFNALLHNFMVDGEAVFMEGDDALLFHGTKFPGKGAAVHAQIACHALPVKGEGEAVAAPLNLLGKEGDELISESIL